MPTFVTGACGFVGLALTEQLLRCGQSVIGFDRTTLPLAAQQAWAGLPGQLVMVQGDVRDAHTLRAAMQQHRPRRLVTLAAITADAQRERATPGVIFEVNVGGVLAALSAAADCGVQRVLHVSSGSAYGASGNGASALVEDVTPLQPEGLYGISKLAAESAALRLAALHGLSLTVARLGTCFGPWESDTGVRDTLSAPLQVLQQARRGQTTVLPRDSLRDWLYVRDAAAALQAVLQAPARPHTLVNVAAGFMGRMSDWCRAVAAHHPNWSWRIAQDPHEQATVHYYAPYDRAPMDITRLHQHTGFVPRYDLAAAAADFLPWHARHGAPQPVSSNALHA
jgi:UDP-glucuronate 4-epimerase